MIPETSTTLLRQIGADVHHARWAEFIARYTPACRQYLRRHFPSLEADDILQETFAALAKALPDYRYVPDEKGHFRNYLAGVLRNKALMALRKQKRNDEVLAAYAEETQGGGAGGHPAGGIASRCPPCTGDVRAPHDGDAAAADDTDWRKAVFEIALQQLMADPAINERTKQIFVRVAVKQEAPAAVAQALGVSRNVVDQQKRRALARFKALVAALVSHCT